MWGQHLVLDLGDCDRKAVRSAKTIRAFTKELVVAIDMIAYGEPLLARFATHDRKAAGYSLVQLIETSNITAHFAEFTGDVYLDIFSCKKFDDDIAVAVVNKYFKPKTVRRTTLARQAEASPAQLKAAE